MTFIFKKFLSVMLMLLTIALTAQNLTPEQIRQKMADIRKSTNWNDPEAAKKANAKIKELSMQLMTAGNSSNTGAGSGQGNQGNMDNKDAEKIQEMTQAMNEYKMQVYEQIWEAAAAGEGADVLLAEQLREDIVAAYQEEDDKSIKNNDFLNDMTYLSLDLSMPGIDLVIDAMPNFRNIKILVITAKEIPSYTDIPHILQNASQFPLEELYIINLKMFLTNFPTEITNFKDLKVLELFQNNIKTIPNDISRLKNLETLMLDINPIQSIEKQVITLPKLKELGIAKTQIPQSEVDAIKSAKPNLNITYP